MGLKPIESGVDHSTAVSTSDAAQLSKAGLARPEREGAFYAFPDAISPHLAARRAGVRIELNQISDWVAREEAGMAHHALSHMAHAASWTLIETAGGVFSPLSESATNFELALALGPAVWILVAANALGVLHDVSATLHAMQARRRAPDHVLLSCAREADASTASNAHELAALSIVVPSAVLARNDDRTIAPFVDRLLVEAQGAR
jgi:dethiobiotin synthetase